MDDLHEVSHEAMFPLCCWKLAGSPHECLHLMYCCIWLQASHAVLRLCAIA
jgi:hypothetical protein